MNDAEFLVDVVTDANRLAGGGEALGRHYEASGLAAANAADIDAMLAAGNAQLEEVLKKVRSHD